MARASTEWTGRVLTLGSRGRFVLVVHEQTVRVPVLNLAQLHPLGDPLPAAQRYIHRKVTMRTLLALPRTRTIRRLREGSCYRLNVRRPSLVISPGRAVNASGTPQLRSEDRI